MPDGSRVSRSCTLPASLVDQAENTFGIYWPHPFIVASVNWLMFLRGDSSADLAAVANHYGLWCFDKAYYAAFVRLRSIVQVRA